MKKIKTKPVMFDRGTITLQCVATVWLVIWFLLTHCLIIHVSFHTKMLWFKPCKFNWGSHMMAYLCFLKFICLLWKKGEDGCHRLVYEIYCLYITIYPLHKSICSRQDIAEILLKLVLNTNQSINEVLLSL